MLMVGLCAQWAAGNEAKRPNILIITTDQQFAEVMSCAGTDGVKTPAMDAIAKQGVRFTNAYVNHPVCMPERYTMYTGRLPCTRRDADEDRKPTISLGNQARKAGYATAYFGKWHIQDRTFAPGDSEHHGFDHYSGGKDQGMTDDAIAYFGKKHPKPFLAVVSYYNPHDICEWGRKKAGAGGKIKMRNGEVPTDPDLDSCPPLPPNFEINPDEPEAVTDRRRSETKGVPSAQKIAMEFSKDDWRQYRWAYHRLVEKVDAQIGRLLKALADEGLAENTVIIFTSDHGDGYGAHRWHQKSVLYEESCRVPFIVSLPGGPRRNETDDRLISVGIDLMPTISELVGTEMPDGPYYGLSVIPMARTASCRVATHPYVVTEAEVRDSPGGDYEGRSVRSEKFKYHVWNRGERREQLFDMIQDPGETTNLAGREAFAQELERHRAMLADWLKRTDDNFAAP